MDATKPAGLAQVELVAETGLAERASQFGDPATSLKVRAKETGRIGALLGTLTGAPTWSLLDGWRRPLFLTVSDLPKALACGAGGRGIVAHQDSSLKCAFS